MIFDWFPAIAANQFAVARPHAATKILVAMRILAATADVTLDVATLVVHLGAAIQVSTWATCAAC